MEMEAALQCYEAFRERQAAVKAGKLVEWSEKQPELAELCGRVERWREE